MNVRTSTWCSPSSETQDLIISKGKVQKRPDKEYVPLGWSIQIRISDPRSLGSMVHRNNRGFLSSLDAPGSELLCSGSPKKNAPKRIGKKDKKTTLLLPWVSISGFLMMGPSLKRKFYKYALHRRLRNTFNVALHLTMSQPFFISVLITVTWTVLCTQMVICFFWVFGKFVKTCTCKKGNQNLVQIITHGHRVH